MITIYEKPAEKLPQVSSLFLPMTFYNSDIFNRIIQTDGVCYNKDKNTFEIPLNKFIYILGLLISIDEVTLVPYSDTNKKCISLGNRKYKLKPYKHQIEGIEYGVNSNGWLLLDEAGLGKSIEMIYLAEYLKEKEGLEHCFIVCGVNSLKYNWADEIEKSSNLSYTILGQKISKNGRVSFATVKERCEQLKKGVKEFFVITNIETLQSSEFATAFNKSKSKFDMIVCDEIHHCKNPTSHSAKTLMKLKAKRCIGLSGTMIMNNPENSFVPLKWSGNTKSTFTQFKHMFNIYGGFGGVQVIGYKNLDILKELIDSCSLRRLKSEVLDLPDKTYIKDFVEMGSDQQSLYDEVEKGIAVELDKLDHKPTIMEELAINMRLRQVTASPSIVSSSTSKSAKLDRLEELVEDIINQGDKVVVFSTFKGTAYEAYERLRKYNPLINTGDQSPLESNNNKKAFQENDSNKVFIGTWQKCGTGITLTAANYCIFIDTPWTDADFKQAADRIYRIGQNKKVFIITLITKNSYDERVQEIIDRKECLSSYLVGDTDKTALSEMFGKDSF